MLELKDLTKTYKPKKGVPVKALQGVSLSLGDCGLVFILGKSGSGKSTLLNIVGGLDVADSGEIIINGKSSKDFNTADYDAYRNTYIGFVFQEYNILNEFTVGENIMLALELQNKKADRQKLDEILKEVDLEGYADRKPNELSGGQKQRVALARALVKAPQIIMADEPTGALDEETGKQVLDTLKKMSKDKLVIVVSHDREFAEQYADRIIRLSDGKVKSDTAELSDSSQKQTVNNEKSTLSRSRLPYRYALKMGVSGVWSKPLRLIMTIILCMVSFTAFGVVDTVNAYSAKDVALNSYLNSDYEASAFTAYVSISGRLGDTSGASEKDIERLKEKTGINYVGVTFLDDKDGYSLTFLSRENLTGQNESVYYNQTFYGYYPASKEFFEDMGFSLIGEIPKAEDEIVITKYLFDQINIGGISLYNLEMKRDIALLPNVSRTAQSLLEQGLYIKLNGEYWKIVGVLDTKADKSGKFNSLKPSNSKSSTTQSLLISDCVEYFRYGYHSIGYITEDRYNAIVKSHSADLEGWDVFGTSAEGTINVRQGKKSAAFWGIASDQDLDKVKDFIWLDGKERKNLNDNEYVIGLNAALLLLQDDASIEMNTYYIHDKTYFEGLVSFDKMSFSELYNSKSSDIARYIASFEEAESIESNKLNIFKQYIMEKINSIPDEIEFYNGKAAFVINKLYSSLYESAKIKVQLFETDIDKFEEKNWRLLYAAYLMSYGVQFSMSLDGTLQNTFLFDLNGGYYSNLTGGRTGETLDKIDAKVVYINSKLKSLQEQKTINYNISYSCSNYNLFTRPTGEDSTIVGIYVPQDNWPGNGSVDTYVFNNTMYRNIGEVEISPYKFLLAPMPKDNAKLQSLVNVHYEESGRVLKMHNGVVVGLELVQVPVNAMRGIFLCLGLGLAVFSIMMIGNYIGTSIANKKRDIGILRALGAKTGDVFSIFVNESILIALINAVVSTVGTIFACIGLNVLIKNMTQVDLSILNFSLRQVIIIIMINIVVAIISSLIPIYRLSKKKPIDCIQDR